MSLSWQHNDQNTCRLLKFNKLNVTIVEVLHIQSLLWLRINLETAVMFGLVLFSHFDVMAGEASVTNIITDGCISLGSASFRADIVHMLPLRCGNRGIVELLITPVLFLPDESNLLL